jgi:hypothetical protein
LLSHAWLVQPDNLFTVVQVLLGLIAAAATLAGFKLLKWHRTNRLRWKDARGREGAVLAVLLGFGPAFTAGLLLLLSIGKSASPDAAAIGAAAIQFLAFAGKTLVFCARRAAWRARRAGPGQAPEPPAAPLPRRARPLHPRRAGGPRRSAGWARLQRTGSAAARAPLPAQPARPAQPAQPALRPAHARPAPRPAVAQPRRQRERRPPPWSGSRAPRAPQQAPLAQAWAPSRRPARPAPPRPAPSRPWPWPGWSASWG